MPRGVPLRVWWVSRALGDGPGLAGQRRWGCFASSSREPSQAPLCRGGTAPQGKWPAPELRPGRRGRHPAPAPVPRRGALLFCLQRSWGQEATGKAGCPGGCPGPQLPGLVAWQVAWWRVDYSSAGEGGGRRRCPLRPPLASLWLQVRRHLTLSTWAAGGSRCLADRQTGTASRTDSCPHPSPCQIVLNYNDKRWQASTATSQNMTNTPCAEPTSAASRTTVFLAGGSARVISGHGRVPRGWPTLDPGGWIRVGASGRGLGPHSHRRHGPEPPHPPGVAPSSPAHSSKAGKQQPAGCGEGLQATRQPPSLWSSFQNHGSSPATHRRASSPPRGVFENLEARGARAGKAQAVESQGLLP